MNRYLILMGILLLNTGYRHPSLPDPFGIWQVILVQNGEENQLFENLYMEFGAENESIYRNDSTTYRDTYTLEVVHSLYRNDSSLLIYLNLPPWIPVSSGAFTVQSIGKSGMILAGINHHAQIHLRKRE